MRDRIYFADNPEQQEELIREFFDKMQTSCLNVIKAKGDPEAMKLAKCINDESLIQIYQVLENTKHNSNFNFVSKLKIN
jgi:hypothetical protein